MCLYILCNTSDIQLLNEFPCIIRTCDISGITGFQVSFKLEDRIITAPKIELMEYLIYANVGDEIDFSEYIYDVLHQLIKRCVFHLSALLILTKYIICGTFRKIANYIG